MLDWKSIGSILATLMFLRTVLREWLPPELQLLLSRLLRRVLEASNPRVSMVIDEYDPSSYANELFDAAHAYIGEKCRRLAHPSAAAPPSAVVFRLSKPKNSRHLCFSMDANQHLDDYHPFAGAPGAVHIRWFFHAVERASNSHRDVRRHYEISFRRRDQSYVQDKYITFVMEEAARIRFKNRQRRLYTNRSAWEDGGCSRDWSAIPFRHPSTFETLAMDPQMKEEIQEDLRRFISRRDYYSRVGRAWKRGYLLHGPPGTGKTSLIAAIANFLEFDVYDLELSAVTSNSQLRKLLVSTSSKSVIVIEDVDCTVDLSDRLQLLSEQFAGEGEKKAGGSGVSLSGVLNFVDGLWSSCVGERLMIFTTNHAEKLDPALLRPGRMDKRIHLSYCGFPAFKMLARNYLGVAEDHRLMGEAARLLPAVNMTPAEIAEAFMGCEEDADEGMRVVMEEIRQRRNQPIRGDEGADRHGEEDGHAHGNIVENGFCSNGSGVDLLVGLGS